MTTRQAFERVAQESGRSVSTVQTTYYRAARRDPNTTVKRRPRRRGGARHSRCHSAARAWAWHRAGDREWRMRDGARLVDEFLAAQEALLAYVRELEADRRSLDAIRGALGGA